MKATTIFRLLVLSLCVLPIVGFLVAGFSASTLPAPLLEYVQSQQSRSGATPVSGGPFVLAFVLSVIVIVLSVIVGLWRFRRWARTCNVIMTVVYVCCLPFMGHVVLPAAVAPVLYAAYFAQGALVAMAYLPPVTDLFVAPKV